MNSNRKGVQVKNSSKGNTGQQQQVDNQQQGNTDTSAGGVASNSLSFSEIIFASHDGVHSLPQWIELYNHDSASADLAEWTLQIEVRDSRGKHRNAAIILRPFYIPPNSAALITTFSGRHSAEITDNQVYNFFNQHSDEFEQNENRNNLSCQLCSTIFMKIKKLNRSLDIMHIRNILSPL